MNTFIKIMKVTGAVKVVATSTNLFTKYEYVKFRMWHPLAWVAAILLFAMKMMSMTVYEWRAMQHAMKEEYTVQSRY